MIKKTFYNLPDEKRMRVVNAVVNEFSAVPMGKISINRIISDARISRGSFYQYFDDKIDLVEVVIRFYAEVLFETLYRSIGESRGDMFFTFEQLFDTSINFAISKAQREKMKNLLINLKYNDDLVSEYIKTRYDGIDEFYEARKCMSTESFRLKTEEDIGCVYDILTNILKTTVYDYYMNDRESSSARRRFKKMTDIIKYGAAGVC